MSSATETSPLKGTDKPLDNDPSKLKKYQTLVYSTTFIAYAMSHFSRKCYTSVKTELHSEAGFSTDLLSTIDTGFMFTYAIGNLCSGILGDRLHPPTITAVGLIGSALCVFALIGEVWSDWGNKAPAIGYPLIIGVWLIHGLFQSTGGPVNTAIMGKWFGATNRGLVFGTWTCHQYIGNIVSALVATCILSSGLPYWWALAVPAICNFAWGVWCYLLLPANPTEVGIEGPSDIPKPKKTANDEVGAGASLIPPGLYAKEMEPISVSDALKIPAVAMYALAFGFFKLVNYTLFFWLPFFLSRSFSPSQANIISSLYDVGMMPGGIIVGVVSDLYGGRRACVIVSFLAMLCPLLWIFSQYADTLPVTLLLIMLGVMGILIAPMHHTLSRSLTIALLVSCGPNNIISSAVAADLAEHPSLKGNTRALGTVTGLINGSGSITAAIGLLFIGRIQTAWGWASVWYFLIVCTVVGCALLYPKVKKEIFDHDEVGTTSAPPAKASYQAIDEEA
ncbi:unnamed protein product [Chrysoparadoxa australica]